ncbi:MAG: AraC family transcriptional regulator [Cytophagaceae bacterium]|nr:AraC family transcriptional regulator [Cytophagaceae bacterium]
MLIFQIAFDTGFYSSQHFSNTFKKIMGYPPRDFRKKCSGVICLILDSISWI